MRAYLKRHRIAIILAIALGVIQVLPNLVLYRDYATSGSRYIPTTINLDERHFTTPRVREVFFNGYPTGDAATYEHTDSPTFMPPLPHIIVGYISKLFNRIDFGFTASDFIFPAIIFFIFYVILFEITKSKLYSIFGAAIMCVLPRYLAFFPPYNEYYLSWFWNQISNIPGRLPLDRFEDPQLTLPFFSAFLYFFVRFLKRNGEKLIVVLLGITFGLLFYVYFYYYVYAALGIFFALVILLAKKEFALAKKLFYAATTGTIISIFYWLNFWRLTRLPTYQDVVSRLGPEHSKEFFLYPRVLFFYAQQGLLALISYFSWKKIGGSFKTGIFFASLLLPVFIVYNIQIITGFNPQPDHWIKPEQVIISITLLSLSILFARKYRSFIWNPVFSFTKILGTAIIIATILIWKASGTSDLGVKIQAFVIAIGLPVLTIALYLLRKYFGVSLDKIVGWFLIVATLAIFLKASLIQRQFYLDNLTTDVATSEIKAIDWLSKNTDRSAVVASPSFMTNTYIMNFGTNKILQPNCLLTTSPIKEILDRFYLTNALFGISKSQLRANYFPDHQPTKYDEAGISYLFGDKYRATEGGSIFTNGGFNAITIPTNDIDKIDQDYNPDVIMRQAKSYRVDYLYLGPREKALSVSLDKRLSLKIVYDADGIQIYQLEQSN